MSTDDTISIEITGVDELLARYAVADPVATQLLTDAMGNAVDYVANEAAIYPGETSANQPPPPYYIRGTGTQYANGTNRQESKQLGQHWQKEIALETDGVVGSVFVSEADVPYAKYVQGRPPFQTAVHARNWYNVVEIKDNVKDKVQEYFHLATAQLVAFLNGG